VRRRTFLIGALGLLGAGAGSFVAGEVTGAPPPPPVLIPRGSATLVHPRRRPPSIPDPVPLPFDFATPSLERRPAPSLFTDLPGDGNLIALTVDDGGSSETVAGYARWVEEVSMRVTFFVTGSLPAWSENAAALAPLIADGRVQLANHTWSHKDLTTASDQQVVDELSTTEEFLQSTFGVSGKPYFRPPFGRYDDRVLAAASSIGYTSCALWYGSLADSGLISEAELLQYATEWLLPQHVVIGHANYPTVVGVMPQLTSILRDRGLQPVTLDDVFTRPA
jgi:peptidoglycan/xylan/chitin deacetylase (PgdA/CDA1 family)